MQHLVIGGFVNDHFGGAASSYESTLSIVVVNGVIEGGDVDKSIEEEWYS